MGLLKKNQFLLIFKLFLVLILNCNLANAEDFYNTCLKNNESIYSLHNAELAIVKRIIDGDTVHLYTGGEIIKARLYGIDCMETTQIHRAYRQAYENNISINEVLSQGILATKALEKIIKTNHNLVYFKTMGTDRYGRLLVILLDKSKNNINDFMITTNYCSPYKFKK